MEKLAEKTKRDSKIVRVIVFALADHHGPNRTQGFFSEETTHTVANSCSFCQCLGCEALRWRLQLSLLRVGHVLLAAGCFEKTNIYRMNPKQPVVNGCLLIPNHFPSKDLVHHPFETTINIWCSLGFHRS